MKIREFEALCYAIIRKEYPYHEEWLLSHRKAIGSICNTVSWVIQRKSRKIFAFCEVTKKLAKERLENIVLCKEAYGAERVIIFIPEDTEVDKRLLEYAKNKNVDIRRVKWE